jgi:dipeptidyl aminopeptidase/acylaminoacyl peptidase
VVTPELYRAAVSVAGISDLPAFLRYQQYRDDVDSQEETILYDHWVGLIGDPKTGAAALKVQSPRQRAAEIRIPVLLMHGSADTTVPVDQSKIMKSALEHAGKSVQLEIFPDQEHPSWGPEKDIKQVNDAIAFFRRVLD